MCNQKGLTLIEVLAAIVIASLVFGVGLMLFSSIQSLWNHTEEKQDTQHNINLTLHTVKKELAGAVEIFYQYQDQVFKELRMKPYDDNAASHSLFHDKNTRTITLYRLINEGDFSNDSINPLENPEQFAKVIDLAGNLYEEFTAFEVQDGNGSALPNLTHSTNGELIKINLSFTSTRVTVQGGKIPRLPETYTILQKLLKN